MKSEKRTAEKKKKATDFVAVSVFVYLFDLFAEWIYRSLSEGFFGRIFTAYSSEANAFENGFVKKYFMGNLKLKEYTRRVKAFLSKRFEESYFLKSLAKFVFSFKAMSLRSFGNFWMAFGIYTIIIYFVKMFVPVLTQSGMDSLIVGIIACIVALPLLFSKGTLISSVGESVFTRLLFADAFGFRNESFEEKERSSHKRANFMTLFGIICGVLTLIVEPLFIPLAVIGVIVIVLVFSSPEIGILLSLFGLPFFSFFNNPTIALAILVLLSFLSYLFKIIRGKRIIKIELIDFIIIIFGVVLYFGGVISVGGVRSFQSAILSCALMIGYILVVNLIRTQKWLDRCFVALLSSATIVSMMGIAQYLFGTLNTSWLDRDYFPDIKGRVTVLFENSNVLAAYLTMIFPLAFYAFLKNRGQKRLLGMISSFSIFLCIIFTWSRGAWLALIISLLLYFMIYTKKTIRFLFAFAFVLPIATIAIPDNILRRLTSIGDMGDSSISYRVYTWRGTLNVIKENLFGGVGYGTDTFSEIYPTYSYAGVEAAEHSHSLYLQILFSLGIVGLLIFSFLTFLFIQQCFESIKHSNEIFSKMQISATFCAVISALIMGAFDYIWFNYRIFYLFWILIALSSAYSRIVTSEQRRKTVYDEYDQCHASIDIKD